jgi:hypothetical protein
MGHVAHMGKILIAYTFSFVGKLKGEKLGDRYVNLRTIL